MIVATAAAAKAIGRTASQMMVASAAERIAFVQRRALHSSHISSAFSKFTMPAMSPTMTEGGLATWKVDEGKPFSAGDVLLEIETDKATMDVEAQDDGVMAKILVEAGEKNVSVGSVIAILAEEGDDLAQWEKEVDLKDEAGAKSQATETKRVEEDSSSSSSGSSSTPSTRQASSSSAPDSHSASATTSTKSFEHPDSPMFPSVLRLLRENDISAKDAPSKIKGTGLKGMLTKGDVLAYLGKASSPTGTFKVPKGGIAAQGGPPAKASSGKEGSAASSEKSEPLTAVQLRAAILGGLASTSRSHLSRTAAVAPLSTPFAPRRDSVEEAVSDYTVPGADKVPAPATFKSDAKKDWLDGLI